jgi:hypothetical protein
VTENGWFEVFEDIDGEGENQENATLDEMEESHRSVEGDQVFVHGLLLYC